MAYTKMCPQCNKEFSARMKHQVCCSKKCADLKKTGPGSPLWKGGETEAGRDYLKVYVSKKHPFVSMRRSDGCVRTHRWVMANHLNRPLRVDETVHHINGNRRDNRIENLELRNGHHGMGHTLKCQNCGSYNVVATSWP